MDMQSSSSERPPVFPKLRNSCENCATAKVGCTKEKPACSRCENRGMTCVYSVTKRAGRAVHDKPRAMSSVTGPRAVQYSPGQSRPRPVNNITEVSASPFTTDALPLSPDLAQSIITPQPHNHQDLFTSLLPNDPGSIELDDLFGSTGSGTYSDSLLDFSGYSSTSDFDFNNGISRNTSSSNLDGSSHTTGRNSIFPSSRYGGTKGTSPKSWESASCCAHKATRSQLSMGSWPFSGNDLRVSDHSSSCFRRAVGFLDQLPPVHSVSCSLQNGKISVPPSPVFEHVVALNDQIVEALGMVLQCPCSSDGSLLLMLSHIICRCLSWYTAAACALEEGHNHDSPDSSPWRRFQDLPKQGVLSPSPSESEYDIGTGEYQRIAVQLILSKLVGVQRLINSFSRRLQSLKDQPHGDEVMDGASLSSTGGAALDTLLEKEAAMLALPATVAQSLEAEMRKRLRQLSQAIIERLRQ